MAGVDWEEDMFDVDVTSDQVTASPQVADTVSLREFEEVKALAKGTKLALDELRGHVNILWQRVMKLELREKGSIKQRQRIVRHIRSMELMPPVLLEPSDIDTIQEVALDGCDDDSAVEKADQPANTDFSNAPVITIQALLASLQHRVANLEDNTEGKSVAEVTENNQLMQSFDNLAVTLSESGFEQAAVAEVLEAMQTLAKYNIMDLGMGFDVGLDNSFSGSGDIKQMCKSGEEATDDLGPSSSASVTKNRSRIEEVFAVFFPPPPSIRPLPPNFLPTEELPTAFVVRIDERYTLAYNVGQLVDFICGEQTRSRANEFLSTFKSVQPYSLTSTALATVKALMDGHPCTALTSKNTHKMTMVLAADVDYLLFVGHNGEVYHDTSLMKQLEQKRVRMKQEFLLAMDEQRRDAIDKSIENTASRLEYLLEVDDEGRFVLNA